MQTYIRIDVAEALGKHLHLGAANGAMRSWQLTIDVTGLHGIGIHDGHLPHPCTAQHLGGIGAYAAHAHYKHMGSTETTHLILAQQQCGTLSPYVPHRLAPYSFCSSG